MTFRASSTTLERSERKCSCFMNLVGNEARPWAPTCAPLKFELLSCSFDAVPFALDSLSFLVLF